MVMGDAQGHISAEDIERYSMGDTSEEEVSRIEEHLLVCETCQNRVTESDGYVSAMRTAATQLRSSPRRRKLPRWIPLLAAAALVIVAATFALRLVRAPAEPAVIVNLEATRGAGIEARAPAGRRLDLALNLAGLASAPYYRIEMVDRLGTPVWQGTTAQAHVPPRATGAYFIRVYSPAGELLREYGLEITR
jgi:hypothetical protein